MAYCHSLVYVTIFVCIAINTQAVPLHGHPVNNELTKQSGNELQEEIRPAQNATIQPATTPDDAELNQAKDTEHFLNTSKNHLELEEHTFRKVALERRRARIKRQAELYHSRCCYVDVFCVRGCRRPSRNGFF